MKILGYENANSMPQKYYSSLIDREIECWGSEPFGEYLICNDCMGIYSIQEVYGNITNYRKSHNLNDFECECGGITHLMYPKNEFLNLLKEYIKGEVSSVLLLENDKVEGFGFLSKTTIGELIKNEFNTRPNSYNKKKLLIELSKILGLINNPRKKYSFNIKKEEIICMNHIYLPETLRKGNNAYKISENIFLKNAKYSGIPVLLETRYDSKFYPIGQSMGFESIISDKYGYIIQYLSDYQNILDFFKTHDSYTDKKEIGCMIHAKRHALNILKKTPEFSGKKFYK